MVLSAKLRNRRLATPYTNYGTILADMESGWYLSLTLFFPKITKFVS